MKWSEQLARAGCNLLVQDATCLCRMQLARAGCNLLVQDATCLCRLQLACAGCNLLVQDATCSIQAVNQNTNVAVEVCKVLIKRTSSLTVVVLAIAIRENKNSLNLFLKTGSDKKYFNPRGHFTPLSSLKFLSHC